MNETRCEECGLPVEDDMCLCYVCAQRNDEAEYEANEIRSAGRTEDCAVINEWDSLMQNPEKLIG